MKKIDLETTQSDLKGLKGFFETALRRFRALAHLMLMVPVYAAAAACLGLSLTPGVLLFRWVSEVTQSWNFGLQSVAYGISIAIGFFLYGFTMILLMPTLNFLFRCRLKAWRGPYYSAESFKWFIHNGLTYLVRYTFLEFVTPSPISIFFYKMMGMKVGRGVIFNSTRISDPSLIEMGNKVTIGGSVTIVAHYGQGGLLVISPVKIGDGCTIGLNASIMGGVRIGDGAKVLPHSVVLPNTIIPDGETWGGVPAVKIENLQKVRSA